MALNIQILNNANSTTRVITVDFVSNLLAYSGGTSSALDYYFTIKTSASDTDGNGYSPRILRSLSSFPLNGSNGAARRIAANASQNMTAAYNSITEMITDHVYDYVYGHDANHNTTAVEPRPGMQF